MVTRKGKIYKFDSIECLAGEYLRGTIPTENIHSLWVMDFNRSANLITAPGADYLHSAGLRSPMGMGLTAFADIQDARKMQEMYAGDIISWQDVLALMKNKKIPGPDR